MIIYLGTSTSLFAAVAIPILIVIPIVFGFSIFWSSVDIAAIMVFLFAMLSSVIMIIYLFKCKKNIYAFGKFLIDRVEIFAGFKQKGVLFYKDIKDIGVGYYQHQGLSSPGITIRCIYLSKNKLKSDAKKQINFLENNERCIKVPYNKKNIAFLQKTLPPNLCNLLNNSVKI